VTDEDLAAIEARAAAAAAADEAVTAAGWVRRTGSGRPLDEQIALGRAYDAAIAHERDADAAFIAAARADVPALLAEIARLRDVIRRAACRADGELAASLFAEL
jgi:hypothetical protein